MVANYTVVFNKPHRVQGNPGESEMYEWKGNRRTEYPQFRENIWLQVWPHPNLNSKIPFDIQVPESPGCCIVSPLVELEVGGLGYSTQYTDNWGRQVRKLTRNNCRL